MRTIERQGFEGVYISGAVLANDLRAAGCRTHHAERSPATRSGHRARDGFARDHRLSDTGFGEPMNAARTVQELEELGLCGCHFEDQQNPKRCGHLDGKTLVPAVDLVKKIRAAATARRDANFVIIARTDARATEGLGGAIQRAKSYVDAGADMIFAEALADEGEFAKFKKAVNVSLLANMTEFGKSKLLTTQQLADAGVNVVIYPVTSLRLAMKAVEDGLAVIKKDEGTQESLLPKNADARGALRVVALRGLRAVR